MILVYDICTRNHGGLSGWTISMFMLCHTLRGCVRIAYDNVDNVCDAGAESGAEFPVKYSSVDKIEVNLVKCLVECLFDFSWLQRLIQSVENKLAVNLYWMNFKLGRCLVKQFSKQTVLSSCGPIHNGVSRFCDNSG
jgi:hypothetical protein